ncbi:ADP-ribosylhydrolase ARH1-like [Mercenaria mercenaria]|uniref:ADP-ribosylhydrolase ARH1-like n=1 Tax=Mercenaria mercenaria TaxID=6596 RepID=UPI00234F0A89|nr:ADP-ribosylhydrolase ARH1-like [Mercenaria mercenaria]
MAQRNRSTESRRNDDWSVHTSKERYVAGMVLSGAGDALGFKNGDWENCTSGAQIHKELNSLGGLENICVKNWIVSDDTVMHLATAEALIQNKSCQDKENLYSLLAQAYKDSMSDMKGRAAGLTCMEMCKRLDPYKQNGYRIPYSTSGGGCGAAMRSMCIGLRCPRPKDIHDLVEISIESGRMTHHHPTGYLGSLASALFASYAVQNREICSWGVGLLETTRLAKSYVRNKGLFVDENMKDWDYFVSKWEQFLNLRKLNDGRWPPHFSVDFDDVRKRDQFYRMISFENTGGASGHDAPMIAYDALLACNGKWEELCKRAMFHGGDSDSTGTIAGFLFGVLYCFQGVPKCNYKQLEYRERLENAGKKLYGIVFSH